MRKLLTAFFSLFPFQLANLFLILLGHKVSWKARIGINIFFVDHLILEEHTKIGSFNFFKIDRLELVSGARIGRLNIFKGPFSVCMKKKARIGKMNKFTKAYAPVTYGRSLLELGEGTGVTYNNFFDLTRSIVFGEHCQVAGKASQFWTHGYMHANEGVERIRVDGSIHIGNNVYVGSRCLINPGVSIGNSINIGGNSSVSKDLTEPGMYVNQPLRHIDTDIHKTREKLKKVDAKNLIEEVYTKDK